MSEMTAFLDMVLEKKLDARAKGYNLDLMVLHREFQNVLFTAVATEVETIPAYKLVTHDDGRNDVYLHGVKILWSGGRLPRGQVWFRYIGNGGKL